MSANASCATRMARVAAPLRSAAIRQFSAAAAATAESSAPAVTATFTQHSTKKIVIASSIAFVAGVDITYAYFAHGQKSK
ncbi:hypothetical protein BGZ97_009839 [Linnemannia gamsii]|uniref:Uncharacterized protein n=1 Tax=Linnemannia gamsii TaxID=64522 RepID=A0A9P6UNC4_9FUNG|nr:hypothetical protein BGZ97_009839 [Linnemannia gamsii]